MCFMAETDGSSSQLSRREFFIGLGKLAYLPLGGVAGALLSRLNNQVDLTSNVPSDVTEDEMKKTLEDSKEFLSSRYDIELDFSLPSNEEKDADLIAEALSMREQLSSTLVVINEIIKYPPSFIKGHTEIKKLRILKGLIIEGEKVNGYQWSKFPDSLYINNDQGPERVAKSFHHEFNHSAHIKDGGPDIKKWDDINNQMPWWSG